jgi:hypothetical protein
MHICIYILKVFWFCSNDDAGYWSLVTEVESAVVLTAQLDKKLGGLTMVVHLLIMILIII